MRVKHFARVLPHITISASYSGVEFCMEPCPIAIFNHDLSSKKTSSLAFHSIYSHRVGISTYSHLIVFYAFMFAPRFFIFFQQMVRVLNPFLNFSWKEKIPLSRFLWSYRAARDRKGSGEEKNSERNSYCSQRSGTLGQRHTSVFIN